MLDDSELLRKYAVGKSDEAFAELVRRHIGSVYAVALRRVGGDTHLAQDVTQEVFTDLARKAVSLSRRATLVGWLFVAARFAAAKSVRRDRQRQSVWRKAQQMTEHEQLSDNEPSWEEIRPVLDDAIHELNERDREAILLHFFDKRSFGDLGAKLCLTESGARMRVERALDKLRISLGRRGITSTTSALALALGSQAMAALPGSLATTVTTAALAGAAPTAGVAALFLMSITKTQLGAAIAVILAGAAVLGVAQHREIAALQTERSELLSQSAAIGRHARVLEVRLADSDAALAGMRTQLSGLKSSGGTNAGGGVSAAAAGVKVIHLKDVIRDHPEYAALQRKELRREIVREYGHAIAALNLSSDMATQLKELLVERETAISDAQGAVTESGLPWDSAAANKAASDAAKESNQAIIALIGSDTDDRLEALKGTMSSGNLNPVDDLALDLDDAGVAISTDQSQTLAQWMHDLGNPAKNPDAGTPGYKEVDASTWQSPLDQQFFAKAATILTPTQLQVLETSSAENNQRDAIINQYRAGGHGALMITN
jgi:RNA polymerase sigma factor (sigma-70 family)